MSNRVCCNSIRAPKHGRSAFHKNSLKFIFKIRMFFYCKGRRNRAITTLSPEHLPQMKTKLITAAAAYICLSTVGSAFSLDFTGIALGTTLPPNPLTISVPGYGNVTFEAGIGSNLIVQDFSGTPAIAFDQGESVRVSFEGIDITDVTFSYAGVSVGESFLIAPDPNVANQFILTMQGAGDGAGLTGATWNVVPEPSSALLGVIGASLLVLRRRR